MTPFAKGNTIGYMRLPSRLPRMAPVESAYLGGLLDGDGSIWQHKRGYWQASVGNDDPELISACLRFTQAGSVVAYRGIHLMWTIGRQNEVLDFVRQIEPYSAKAHDMLGRIEHDISWPGRCVGRVLRAVLAAHPRGRPYHAYHHQRHPA